MADRTRIRWCVRPIIEKRDLWIGVFVSPEKTDEASGDFVQRTYILPLPCLGFVVERWWLDVV